MHRIRAFRLTIAFAVAASAMLGALRCGGSAFSNAPATSDGGQPSDGATPQIDAGGGGGGGMDSAPPLGFCASLMPQPFFCDDWDDGELTKGWNPLPVLSRYGDVSLDTTIVKSMPRSLLADTTHVVSNETTVALLQREVGHVKTFRFGVDVYVESYGFGPTFPASEFTALTSLAIDNVSLSFAIVAPSECDLVEGLSADAGTAVPHPIVPGLPMGAWTRLQINATLATTVSPGSAVVMLGGNTVYTGPLSIQAQQGISNTLSLGLYLTNAPATWKVHYDNLIFDKT